MTLRCVLPAIAMGKGRSFPMFHQAHREQSRDCTASSTTNDFGLRGDLKLGQLNACHSALTNHSSQKEKHNEDNHHTLHRWNIR